MCHRRPATCSTRPDACLRSAPTTHRSTHTDSPLHKCKNSEANIRGYTGIPPRGWNTMARAGAKSRRGEGSEGWIDLQARVLKRRKLFEAVAAALDGVRVREARLRLRDCFQQLRLARAGQAPDVSHNGRRVVALVGDYVRRGAASWSVGPLAWLVVREDLRRTGSIGQRVNLGRQSTSGRPQSLDVRVLLCGARPLADGSQDH